MFAVLWPALATGLCTTVGALPFLMVPSVSRRFYDTLLGLGAGLMLAAATLGLLSTALREVHHGEDIDLTKLALVLGGFLVGVALLALMDRLIPHEHAGGHHVHVHDEGYDHQHDHDHERGRSADHQHGQIPGHTHGQAHAHAHEDPHCKLDARGTASDRTARAQGLLVVGVMALHRVPEGLAIGAAYAGGGAALGLTLASAIAVQNAVEGAVMAAPLRRGGLGAPALLVLVTASGLAVPAAAVVGYLLSSVVAWALPGMLSLAAGALIYLTCNEVIPESHSHGNEVRATFGVVAGFVVIMLLQVLFGHAD